MIDGVWVIPLTVHMDDRGYLIEIARQASDPEPHGVLHQFGQAYLVGVWEIDAATLDYIPEIVTELPTVENGGIEVAADGRTTITYTIHPGAMWSDGVPITGRDLAFTYQSIVNLELPDPDLLVYQEIIPATVVVTESTFAYALPRPTIEYERLFGMVIPRHTAAESDLLEDWNDRPWTSGGPFVFEGWRGGEGAAPGAELAFTRNPSYWKLDDSEQRLPYLDEVVFTYTGSPQELITGFSAGEFDVAEFGGWPDVYERMRSLDGVQVEVRNGMVWEHLSFQFGGNDRNRATLNSNTSFRRAVAHAVDRQALADLGLWANRGPMVSLLDPTGAPTGSDGWDRYPYDPALAEGFLSDACFQLSLDCAAEPPVAVITTSSNADLRPAIGRAVSEMLGAIGIDTRLALEDSALFFGRTFDRGTWDLGIWAIGGEPGLSGAVRALAWLDPAGPPPAGRNYARWGTPAVAGVSNAFDQAASTTINDNTRAYAALMEQMSATVDRAELLAAVAEAEEILADQVVLIPLAAHSHALVSWPERIAGVRHNPTRASFTWNLERWYRADR